jgi:SAM-dependent methyltransferase
VRRRGGWTLAGLAGVSAASLAYELGLTRLLSLQQLHHFAFLVVSLAVLAAAAGGVARALLPERSNPARLALAAAISIPVTFLILNWALFDSFSVAWDRRQWPILLVDLLAASAPFLFCGWLVASVLAEAGQRAHRAYAINLVGAGVGVALALFAHTRAGTPGIWFTSLALALLGAAWLAGGWSRGVLAACAAAALLIGPVAARDVEVRLSPYKPLAVARLLPEARQLQRAWSVGSQVDVIEASGLRGYPGLSLRASPDLPSQAGLYLDGDGPVMLTLACPDSAEAQNLAQHLPSSLTTVLRPGGRMLVLDAGGGLDVLVAVGSGAGEVWASSRSTETSSLLLGPLAEATCGLARIPGVHWLREPPRPAMAQLPPASFDVVLVSLSDAYRPVTAGAYSLREDYLLTVEGVESALRLLKPDGVLAVTRWLSTPPAEETRALATLLQATGEAQDPRQQFIAYRGMRTATILYAAAGWSETDAQAAWAFLEANGFDPILFPGAPEARFNRFNRLPEDSYRTSFETLMDAPAGVPAISSYDLRPPSDDRPFFFHYFRWQQLPETLAGLGLTAEPFGGSGYLLLLGLLGVVGLFAIALAVSPAASPHARRSPLPARWAAYFALVGGGFMLVEVALIQRLTVVLVEPAVSLAVVVSTLLLASGAGSMLANRLPVRGSLLLLALALLAMTAALGTLLEALLAVPSPQRQILTALSLLAVGFLMGVPFSAGLIRQGGPAGGRIAWAWAVNGAASGVAGVLAALLSLHAGLGVTLTLGAVAYALAGAVVPTRPASAVGR